MVFRRAVPGDAPELYRLNQEFNGPGEKQAEAMAEDLSQPGPEWVFVAQKDESLTGFCCCQVKRSFCYSTWSVEVAELYVAPEFRRQGVGRGLLEQVRLACQGHPVERLELLTGGDNLPARAFYESLGFSLSGEAHYEQET